MTLRESKSNRYPSAQPRAWTIGYSAMPLCLDKSKGFIGSTLQFDAVGGLLYKQSQR